MSCNHRKSLTASSTFLFAAVFILPYLAGCGESGSAAGTANQSANTAAAQTGDAALSLAPVESADLGQTRPAHSVGRLYLAGLPDVEDFPLWKEKGVETVVTLLSDDEIDWDEGAAVRGTGMQFVQIPYGNDDEVFDRTREVLRENGDRPLVLHCKASNRVGAVWLTHRVLDEGANLQRALAEAKEAGLRSSRLEQQALDYIHRKQHAATDGAAGE